MKNQKYVDMAIEGDFTFIETAKKEVEGLLKYYEKMPLDGLTELHNTLKETHTRYKTLLQDVKAQTLESMYSNYANILAMDIKEFVSKLLKDDSVEVKVDIDSTRIDFQFSQENEKFGGAFSVYLDKYAKVGVNIIRQYNYGTMGFNPFEQNSKYLVHRFAGLGYLATQVKADSVLVQTANKVVLREGYIEKYILKPIDDFCWFIRGKEGEVYNYIHKRKKEIFFGGLTIGQKIVWGYNIGVVTKINRKTVEISNYKGKKRVKKDELYSKYNLEATEIANKLEIGMVFINKHNNQHKIVLNGVLDIFNSNNVKVTEFHSPYFDNRSIEKNILNILTSFIL